MNIFKFFKNNYKLHSFLKFLFKIFINNIFKILLIEKGLKIILRIQFYNNQKFFRNKKPFSSIFYNIIN